MGPLLARQWDHNQDPNPKFPTTKVCDFLGNGAIIFIVEFKGGSDEQSSAAEKSCAEEGC